MIPGFVTLYRNKQNNICLYFYPGCTDNFDKIYEDIDLSSLKVKYSKRINVDGSILFTFSDKSIKKITCKLMEIKTSKMVIKTFEI